MARTVSAIKAAAKKALAAETKAAKARHVDALNLIERGTEAYGSRRAFASAAGMTSSAVKKMTAKGAYVSNSQLIDLAAAL